MYSNWQDKIENCSLENLVEKILDNAKQTQKELDPVTHNELLYSVEAVFDENQTITINNEEIIYNLLTYRYERVNQPKKFDQERSKRINLYESRIVVYRYKEKFFYIINKAYNNTTKKNLRKLLNYSGKGEIVEQWTQGIKTDLFIWMIHYILDCKGKYIDSQGQTKISSVTGFKGETTDKLAEINGSGEKIMEMLTTLLFLFENKNLSKIQTMILKNREKFKLDLGSNHVDIHFDSYEGDDFFSGEEQIFARVSIKVFVDVLPNLVKNFSDELEAKEWSASKEEAFFKNIGRAISKKINDKLREKKTN